MEKLPITAAGHAALIEELRRRQQEDRPRIIQMRGRGFSVSHKKSQRLCGRTRCTVEDDVD